MFNNSNGYSLADIAAATGNDNNGGFGFNGDGAWILILFILILAGGWGGYGNGGGGGAGYVAADVQRGFDQSAVISGLTGIAGAINTGFSNAEVSRCNAQANILQTLNNNQGNLSNQLNTIAMNQQNCCCENRAGLADLKYTVATENCADRAALSDGIRDIIASNTANTQAILDKLCQQEIDALKSQNDNLRTQLNMANLAASQTAQNAFISQGFANEVDQLYSRLSSCPIPSTPVFGRTQIFTCNNNGYGCGCAG